MRAAIYVRVSTERQAREGLSLQAQERACRDYAAEHGYDVADVYVEAHSASEDYRERLALAQLLDAARVGAFEAVIFFDPDRMTRKRAHRWILDETLREHGVTRLFVTSPYDDTLEGQLLADIHAYVAEKEIDKKRGQIQASYRERMLSGKLLMQGNERYGYRRNADTGKRDIYEPEAAVVRRIFRLYTVGESARAIADILNAESVPSPAAGRYTYQDGRPMVWRHAGVLRILAASEYHGQTFGWRYRSRGANNGPGRRPESEWLEIPDATPAIIDDVTWQAAQQRVERHALQSAHTRNQHGPVQALLRGLIRCERCGAPMHVEKSHERYIYRCASRDYASGRCGAPYVRVDAIDPFVWECVAEALTDPALVERALQEHVERAESSPYAADRERVERALAANRREQERHLRRLRALDDADLEALIYKDLSQLRSDERTLADELTYIDGRMAAQQAALDHVAQLSAYVARVSANLDAFDFDNRRRTLEALGVEVHASGSNTDRSPAQWEVRAMIPVDSVVSSSESKRSRSPVGRYRGWCGESACRGRR